MPCQYYTDAEEKQMAHEDNKRLCQELDLATERSCRLAHLLEILGSQGSMTKEDQVWYQEHKRLDKLREQKELQEKRKRDLHAEAKVVKVVLPGGREIMVARNAIRNPEVLRPLPETAFIDEEQEE